MRKTAVENVEKIRPQKNPKTAGLNHILFVFLFSTPLFFVGCDYIRDLQAQREKVRTDLIQVCESFIPPAGYKKVDFQEVIKPDRGSYTLIYEAEMGCVESERYFYSYFSREGWQPTRPGSVYFFRDKHVVSVLCNKDRSPELPRTIKVICSWDVEGTKKDTLQ